MQDAIQERKKVLAEKAATLRRTLGRSKGDSLDPLDDSSLSRSAKVCSLVSLVKSTPSALLIILYRFAQPVLGTY